MATTKQDLSGPAESPAKPTSPLFYVLLAAALLIFIQTFALLSPILLSLLLILLISLALNPVVSRMRAWTGGRRGAAGLLALTMAGVIGLTGWALFVPMKDSVAKFADQMPEYLERLQKPLIRLEQQAESSEKRLQAEVTMEIAIEEAGEPEVKPGAVEAIAPPDLETGTASGPDLSSVRSSLGKMFEDLFGRFTAVAFNSAQILIVLVTVFFGVIYMLMNPRPIF